ncbi:MAG: VIT domain-containing protein [Planctomycetaceae bacterium]|nr:VIT domain-containing protein [Planctomycetaceae bacterium]
MNSIPSRLQLVLPALLCLALWGCGESQQADQSQTTDAPAADMASETPAPMESEAAPEAGALADSVADAEDSLMQIAAGEEEKAAIEPSAEPADHMQTPFENIESDQARVEKQGVAPPSPAGSGEGQRPPESAASKQGMGLAQRGGESPAKTSGEGASPAAGQAASNAISGGSLPSFGSDGGTDMRRRALNMPGDSPVRGGLRGAGSGAGAGGFGGAGGGGGLGGGGGGAPTAQKIAELKKLSALSELQPGEELWVIAKPPAGTRDNQIAGTGSLLATLPDDSQVPCPLKHTDVKGRIAGYIATVNVTQQFENPFEDRIEAVYTFPLPDSAAVSEFVMTVGERKIRGIIREKEKAEQIYEAAKAQGHVASLMTQQRANIFTQKVANIEPGHQIDIDIRYFSTLQYDDGAYEFVFPMVVGPRFNPGGSDGIGAVARGKAGTSGQTTEIEYLAPGERSGRDVSLTLELNAGVTIEDMHSVNHAIDVEQQQTGQRTIRLAAGDSIPNKDFVFRYAVAGQEIKTALMTQSDSHGQYFTMMLYPPADLQKIERAPMEMVFVLDCSGSMRGKPIQQAKNAIAHCVQNLTPRDTFQIIQFSSTSSTLGPAPVIATEENIRKGLDYLSGLTGTGPTHAVEGVKAALDFPHDEGRFRIVSFMTDGFIGNENDILKAVNDKLGASRIFSFGVGSSPNRMLMDRMAILGKGAVAYLSLNDDAVEVMDRFNERISHPAMTDLQIDWGKMDVADVYPKRIPDLIVGRPVIISGRFKGEVDTVSVNGRAGMQPASFDVSAADKQKHSGVGAVWARLKIKDMMNTLRTSPEAAEEIRQSVLQTALNHSLMSNFTAFIAVDSLTKTDGKPGRTVKVPTEVPDGVDYNATVSGSDE